MTSSAGGNPDDSSSVTSCHGENVQTAAEKSREKRLREDPMADVLGPLYVCCKRCGNRIKLSPKSSYDTFHWQKHKERCLKKPAGAPKQRSRASQENLSPFGKKYLTSSSKPGASSVTPPLTTDDADELGEYNRAKDDPPSPGLSDSTPKLAPLVRPLDLAFEDYLFRSRRKLTRELSPPTPNGWQSWSWSQLKAPAWVIASYPDYVEDGDRTNDDIDSQKSA